MSMHAFVMAPHLIVVVGLLAFLTIMCGCTAPQAKFTSDGLSLLHEKDADWKVETRAGSEVAAVVPSNDYYRRAAYAVRMDNPPADGGWLVVEYLDEGYGVISVSPRSGQAGRPGRQGAADQWGVARLNTGGFRRAQFRFAHDALAGPLYINGVEYLRSVKFAEKEPPREPIPEVKPGLVLKRPLDVVTGALENVRSEQMAEVVANLRNQLPLALALGFNGVELYVRWNAVERKQGVYDWSYYDSLVAEFEKHGLKWFPMVPVGPAYTLPEWFHDGPDFVGFVCLEHRQRTDIQSFFPESWPPYVERFLSEFGKHYAKRPVLQGARTGATGTYGETLYPGGGSMPYRNSPWHSHLGYWAGDEYAVRSFRAWLKGRYATIADLNAAWKSDPPFASFDQVQTFLPDTARTSRQRLDFCDWYMGAMTKWGDDYMKWLQAACPGHPIYQSIGGHEEVDLGADIVQQVKDLAKRGGGARVTNEADSYAMNFAITRVVSSAARFYGAKFGLEPAGGSSARGVMARLYNAITTDADHLFYYFFNFTGNDQATGLWMEYAPLLDRRARPMVDVGVFYPNTSNKLDASGMRMLYGSGFFGRSEALRSVCDHDYIGEQMILDGALDRYKVLVFVWGETMEKPVLDRIAQWVQAGGTLITPLTLQTVEGDSSIARQWEQGQTGKGRVIRFRGDYEPPADYIRFLRRQFREMPGLRPEVAEAMRIEKPDWVYWSVLETGDLVLLNFDDQPATVRVGGRTLHLEPYGIVMEHLTAGSAAKK